jgi:hypothetical protein
LHVVPTNPLGQERLGNQVLALPIPRGELILHEGLESPLHARGGRELVPTPIVAAQWTTRFARESLEYETLRLRSLLPDQTEVSVEDALREFPADEVVVVTRPDEEATWLEEGSSEAIAQRLGGLKVTRLVVSDSG